MPGAIRLFLLDPQNPDVVVLRFEREEPAVRLCREVRARQPSTACVLVSSGDLDDALFGALLRAAHGLASQAGEPEALAEELLRASRGVAELCERLVSAVHEDVAAREPDQVRTLTAQQRRVAEGVARGLTNSEIAAELHLSPHTVGNHLSRIMQHLGARNRTEVGTAMVRLAARGRRPVGAPPRVQRAGGAPSGEPPGG